MKSKDRRRVAIIGLGAATRNIHLPAYRNLADKIKIVGGCDPESEARTKFRNDSGIKEVFDDPLKMIEETKPDIVSICSPPSLHIEQSLMALEQDCHVFCEKPLAEDLETAAKLVEAAEKSSKIVVVNNQFPYMNIHLGAKKMIGSQDFGRLLFLQAWQTFQPTSETEANWRGQLKRRVCFEFGIHVFELVRYFFEAEPVRVTAQMPEPMPDQKADLINIITLEFSDGRAASIILNRLSRGPERYLDMRLDGEFASVHTSIGGRVGFEAGIHTREKRPFFNFNFIKGGSAILQVGSKSKILAKDGLNPFVSSTEYHFRNFVNCIETGEIPPGTVKDNFKTLALVFAAYKSSEKRCAIEMDQFLKGVS